MAMRAADVKRMIELRRLREKEQDLFTEIQMLHQKIDESKFGIDRNASAALKKDLAMKYKKALVDSGRVRDLAQQCLTALIPYAVGRVEEVKQAEDDFKAEIAGGGDNNIWEHVQRNIQLQNGLQVAFREEEDKWILARIKRYDPKGRKRYEVEDADPQAESSRRKVYQSVEPRQLIPLPTLAEWPLSQRPEFRPGQHVFAMFPGTTSFYKAKVVSGPQKRKLHPEYTLEFDDDNLRKLKVSVEHVAPLSEWFRA